MKRLICRSLIVAVIVTFGVGYAIAQPKTYLTKDNVKVLQGTWEGWADFAAGVSCRMVLVVDNASVPLKGNAGLYNIPGSRADLFPGGMDANTYAGPYEGGTITNKGDFIISGAAGNFGEFTLLGDKKLDGWFYLWGARGTIRLQKK